MKKSLLRLSFLCLLLFTSSCATIFSGWKQRINIDSHPAAATVYIDNVEMGKTPFSKKLLRRKDHTVTIKLEGHKDYEIKLKRSVNNWVFGNIVIGGAVGALVDLATGAIYKLTPNQIKAQFANGVVVKDDASNLYIAVAMNVDDSFEKIGQMELEK